MMITHVGDMNVEDLKKTCTSYTSLWFTDQNGSCLVTLITGDLDA